MRLHRFFSTTPIVTAVTNHSSDAALIHQLKHVFRLHEGDKAVFFDGTGHDYESEIVSLDKSEMVFRVLETKVVKPFCETKVSLVMSLIKKDNLEWVIQKATELGVSEFIPVLSERSEKKGFNKERATKIMIEALEQSGRSDVPVIHEPESLEDFLEKEKRNMVLFHVTGDGLKRAEIQKTSEVLLCIGPEGGWSDKEVEMFVKKGAKVVRLDTPVLRAETAAISVAILFLVG